MGSRLSGMMMQRQPNWSRNMHDIRSVGVGGGAYKCLRCAATVPPTLHSACPTSDRAIRYGISAANITCEQQAAQICVQ
jgi:hypothetical protein